MVKKKIMVVDDDPSIVVIVKDMLESEGYETMWAYSGQECLDKIRRERPDLILLDIIMEPMNGWQTLDAIKADENLRSIPVLMLTVVPLTPEAVKSKAIENIEIYIVKPFSKKELVQEVGSTLGKEESVESKVASLKLGADIAEEYKKLAKYVDRHTKLVRTLEECCKREGTMSTSARTVLKIQRRLIEDCKKRIAEIEEMAKGR
ncbi:MAG: response regulator [Methanocellales archaeon]|nr:response regulator [Methanocellales archaeon]